ncbi:TPA: hypothetical protein DCR49_10550 [Candidatus Delongbacteria bacterium]|nr:MAG: hypothetical protein A2Y39_07265 [Candidatus Delongbacteria bacterium GWF2_40_14]HAQ62417.1 hypothetical protein [Candidatus Delongbacteria bacterium]
MLNLIDIDLSPKFFGLYYFEDQSITMQFRVKNRFIPPKKSQFTFPFDNFAFYPYFMLNLNGVGSE